MIITLKGANFSESNIGTLSTWRITTVLGAGATSSNTITSVDRESNTGYTTTITIAEGYELGAAGITVTMGGVDITSTAVSGLTITIPTKVTGNVVIKVPTQNTATGEEDGGDVTEPSGTLPSGYTALANITTDGTGYINTGFIPNENTKIETTISVTTLATQAIFGAQNKSNNPAYKGYILENTNFKFGDKAGSVPLTANTDYTITMSKEGVTANGTTAQFTDYTYSGTPECPMYLLCNNNAGTAAQFAINVKMSSFKIWDNGTLVRDFVPCKNSANDTGMYDLVNNTFYSLNPSASSGDSNEGASEAYTKTITGNTAVLDTLCSRDVWHDKMAINTADKKWYSGGINRATAYYLKLPVGTVITSTSDYKIYVTHSTTADVSTYDGTGSGGWVSSYTVNDDKWTHLCISMASNSAAGTTPGVVGVEAAYNSVSIQIPGASSISVTRAANTENYVVIGG